MDFLITGFIYWIFNTLCPKEEYIKYGGNTDTQQIHYENGAAFFFSSSHLGDNKQETAPPPVNEDYDRGPEW
ncbi:MAG: hypothetical protein DRJ10_08345 [Bacteroidetes bacterium]|nr:MAG: hypothetical protein DRJ10_08345 [Bacteroidota bacterium]